MFGFSKKKEWPFVVIDNTHAIAKNEVAAILQRDEGTPVIMTVFLKSGEKINFTFTSKEERQTAFAKLTRAIEGDLHG